MKIDDSIIRAYLADEAISHPVFGIIEDGRDVFCQPQGQKTEVALCHELFLEVCGGLSF